jgi:hypothetical protein
MKAQNLNFAHYTKRGNLLRLIELHKGQFFTVEFIKKDGTLRKMNCRTGVKKYLVKNGRKIKTTPAIESGILKVYDTQNGYRSINIDTIKTISIGGIKLKY